MCGLGGLSQALYDFGMLDCNIVFFSDVSFNLIKNRLLPAFCAFAHGLIRGMRQVLLPATVTDRFKVLAVVIVKGFMRGLGRGLAPQGPDVFAVNLVRGQFCAGKPGEGGQ